MTKKKDLKRRARERSRKTGESYTTALRAITAAAASANVAVRDHMLENPCPEDGEWWRDPSWKEAFDFYGDADSRAALAEVAKHLPASVVRDIAYSTKCDRLILRLVITGSLS